MCDFIKNEILSRIKSEVKYIYIDCPECENMYDDQYQCGTCGCSGGYGKIPITDYIKILENPEK